MMTIYHLLRCRHGPTCFLNSVSIHPRAFLVGMHQFLCISLWPVSTAGSSSPHEKERINGDSIHPAAPTPDFVFPIYEILYALDEVVKLSQCCESFSFVRFPTISSLNYHKLLLQMCLPPCLSVSTKLTLLHVCSGRPCLGKNILRNKINNVNFVRYM